MQLNNTWAAILGLLVGIVFTIAFWTPMTTMIGLAEDEGKIFIGIIVTIVFMWIGAIIPLKQGTQDDRGGTT